MTRTRVGMLARASAVAATFLYAPAGLLLFLLMSVVDRARFPARPWLVLAALLAPLVLQQAFIRGTPWELLGTAAVLLGGGVVVGASRTAVARGGVAALVLLVAALGVERIATSRTWAPSDVESSPHERITAFVRRSQTLTEGDWERAWSLAAAGDPFQLDLEARLAGGTPGIGWFAYHPSFRIEARSDDGEPYSRIYPPGAAASYVTRRVHTDAPLAGRTFRVRLQARTAEPTTTRGCTGVILREVRGSGSFACHPVSLDGRWRTVDLTWQVPAEAESPILRVELRIPGEWYDVRRVALEELRANEWVSLAPLAPTGVWLRMALPGEEELAWPAYGFIPTDTWTRHAFQISNLGSTGLDEVRFVATVENGLAVEIRAADLIAPGSPSAVPDPTPERQRLWYGHSNLLGHGLVATGLVTVVAAGPSTGGVVGAGAVAIGILASSSRAALLGAVLGLAGLVAIWVGRRRASARPALLLLAVAAAVLGVGVADIERLHLWRLDGGNSVSRTEIWRVAWDAMLERPARGIGEGRFDDAWMSEHAGDGRVVPLHAHNFWLQWGATYGVLGLATAAALTVGLGWLAWRRGRWLAMGVVVPVLAMQLVDVTLVSSYVLLPLILALNMFHESPPRAAGQRMSGWKSEP